MNVAAPPLSPYKGLAPFEDSELDALLFFGRERETEVIVANLVAAKLTILYGPSGVGKSSILRAAVVRRLRELAPLAQILVLDRWVGETALPLPEDEAYLILDQFEEYFLYHEDGPLLDLLPELLARPRVHVLISMREDALARLDAFKARIPSVFANSLRIDHLDRAAAREALVGPVGCWNEVVSDEPVGIEGALVDAVLDEVAAAPQTNGASPVGVIEAPYLQLVMERIWEEERTAGSALLRLATLQRLGGAPAIVSAHLDRTLGALGPREAELAASALKFLVTPSRTKIAHSLGDLVGYTDESPAELRSVLELLATQRILRATSVEGGQESRYEIFHDVLAEPVLAWRRDFEAQTALERERRAAARRHQRLLTIAVGAALLAAAMVALTVYAFAQRGEAAKQKRVAVQQAARAHTQQRAAEQAKKEALSAKTAAQRAAVAANEQRSKAQAAAKQADDAKKVALSEKRAAQQSAKAATAASSRAEKSRRHALHEATLARAAERQAVARDLAASAVSFLTVDPVKSVRLALEAAARERSQHTQDVLRAAVATDRLRAVLPAGGGPVRSAVFSNGGSLVLTVAARGGARLFQARGGLVRTLGSSPASAAAFSPDDSLVATAGKDGVRLWSAKDGSLVRTFSSAGADAVAFSADGRRVAEGGPGGAGVWSVDGGELASLPHQGTVTSVAFDGAGARIVTVATDPAGHLQARIFDAGAGSLQHLLPELGITGATFSPDGAWVATSSTDRTARLWDVATGTEHSRMTGDGRLVDIEFSRDGKLLVAANESGGALVGTVPAITSVTQLVGTTNKVEAASFSPDGQFVVIASLDETARVFRSGDGFQVALLAGNHGGVLDAEWGPVGTSIVTAGEDGSARVWSPGTRPQLDLLGRQGGAVSVVRLSPDGRLVLSAGADHTARIWRLGGGADIVLHHDGPVADAVFSQDGSRALTGSDDGTGRLWRTSTGALARVLPHGAPVRAVAFSPDGRIAATAGSNGTTVLWRVADGVRLHVLTGHGKAVDAVAFSPDGGLVATGSVDRTARIWSVATGAQLHILQGHTAAVLTVAFSSDGSRLVTASADATARLWSTVNGTSLAVLRGHTAAVNDAEFSSDGTLIVTASADSDARLWNGRSGKLLRTLRGHFGAVQAASFSPNGRWLVTGGPSTVLLWSTATGRPFSATGSSDPYLRGPTLAVNSVVFGRDGKTIVAGSADGTVRAYHCDVCGGLGDLRRLGHALLRDSAPR